jgi:hypothetical protein
LAGRAVLLAGGFVGLRGRGSRNGMWILQGIVVAISTAAWLVFAR